MNIKGIVRAEFPNFFERLKSAKGQIKDYRLREQKKSFGPKNPDKTIYIIRTDDSRTGLMCYFNNILGHIAYALERGWIPVVDMKNYPNTYLAPKLNGKTNSWEYYFEQPGTIGLDEAYESKNVVLSQCKHMHSATPRYLYYDIYKNPEIAATYYSIIACNMSLNPLTMEYMQRQKNKIFPKNEKVVGVVCRGTDLIGYINHSKQPTVLELCKITERIMAEYKCNYVFVASDEDRNIESFRDYFGRDTILVNDCVRFDSYKKVNDMVLGDIKFNRDNDEFLRGREYLTTVVLLSKCDCLVGSLVGATVGAIGMNQNKYEHVEIYDKGVY